MITRAQALVHSPRRAAYLTLLVIPWAAAAVWNAWELRDELIAGIKAQGFIFRR